MNINVLCCTMMLPVLKTVAKSRPHWDFWPFWGIKTKQVFAVFELNYLISTWPMASLNISSGSLHRSNRRPTKVFMNQLCFTEWKACNLYS